MPPNSENLFKKGGKTVHEEGGLGQDPLKQKERKKQETTTT